jgi:acetyl esterase/lipase
MTTKQGEKVSNEEKCDARILIAGESSGGGLAAELCQRLVDAKLIYSRDEFEFIPLPAAQLLLNPMLDDRTLVDESTKEIPSHLIWNHTSNLFAWKSYLGPTNKPGQCGLPDYSVAARRVDLSNLSPCWIAIGDSDLFYPECKEYFERLTKSGIEAEYLEIVGGYHGMFNIANGTESKIKNAWESFQKFAIKHLTKEK